MLYAFSVVSMDIVIDQPTRVGLLPAHFCRMGLIHNFEQLYAFVDTEYNNLILANRHTFIITYPTKITLLELAPAFDIVDQLFFLQPILGHFGISLAPFQ